MEAGSLVLVERSLQVPWASGNFGEQLGGVAGDRQEVGRQRWGHGVSFPRTLRRKSGGGGGRRFQHHGQLQPGPSWEGHQVPIRVPEDSSSFPLEGEETGLWHRGGTVGPDLCVKIPRPRAYVNPSGLTVADGEPAIPGEAAGNAVLPLASKTVLLATFLSTPCHFLPHPGLC